MSRDDQAGIASLKAETSDLLEQASSWLSDTMDAWSDEAPSKVSALAPLAVELALKAVLWQRNPALLVPLERQHEWSLIELTTTARLTSEKLRTIGLGEALSRATAVADKEPKVNRDRQRRIVTCRNGSMHVGAVRGDFSRHVLTDCIALLSWALDLLHYPEERFFGSHLGDCRSLLTQGRSEMEQAVLARLAKHRRQYDRLIGSLDEEVVETTVDTLQAAAMNDHWPSDPSTPEPVPARYECPACRRDGAIFGAVEIDADADAEYEDGEIVYHGYWIVTLSPTFFICKVCGLRLWGPQELEPAGLPGDPYQPKQQDLGDFDPGEYAAAEDWYRDDL